MTSVVVYVYGHVSSSEVLPCLWETLRFPFRIIKAENYYFTSGFLKFGFPIVKNVYPIISDFWNIFKSKCNFPFKICFSLVSSPENFVSLNLFLLFFLHMQVYCQNKPAKCMFFLICMFCCILYIQHFFCSEYKWFIHIYDPIDIPNKVILFIGSYRERLKWRCMINRLSTYLQGESELTTHLSRTQTINANNWHLLIIYAMVTEIS